MDQGALGYGKEGYSRDLYIEQYGGYVWYDLRCGFVCLLMMMISLAAGKNVVVKLED